MRASYEIFHHGLDIEFDLTRGLAVSWGHVNDEPEEDEEGPRMILAKLSDLTGSAEDVESVGFKHKPKDDK